MSGEKETGAESVLDSEELAILEEEGVDVDAIEDDSGDETGLDASPETPEGEPEAPGEGEERVNPAENAPPGFVPTAAVQQEREEKRLLKEQLQELQDWRNGLTEKLAMQRQAAPSEQEAQAQQPQTPPDPNVDPFETITYLSNELAEMKRHLQEQQQQTEQQRIEQEQQAQSEQEWQQFYNDVDRAYTEATNEDPAVPEAFEYLEKSITAELQLQGATPQQIDQHLDQARRDFSISWANRANVDGVKLGDYIKQFATSRGWQGGGEGGNNKNGAAEAIDKQKQALEANRTLSGGASANSEEIDLENISGAELEELAATNPELFARFGA